MASPKKMTSDRLVILVVDDDAIFRNRLCRAFRDRGCEAYEAATAQETSHLASNVSPDLVLLDLKMPGLSGLDLVQNIKKLDATIAVIILTGYGSIATAMQALKLGADHYLSKPADADQILAAYHGLDRDDLDRDATEKRTPTIVPSLARVEWEHIQRVLSDCSGNISQAAKLLGIHRRSLQRKLSKFAPMN
jgi:two-component system response regulator RegA